VHVAALVPAAHVAQFEGHAWQVASVPEVPEMMYPVEQLTATVALTQSDMPVGHAVHVAVPSP
jgi:hypothetical protein